MQRPLLSLIDHKPQNILFQRLASYFSRTCGHCGALRISQAFDDLLEASKLKCWKCRVNAKLAKSALIGVFSSSGLNKDDISRLLTTPLYRRIIIAIISGLSTFGFRTPQPTGSPLAIVWNFTNSCNLRCAHCYQDAGEKASNELSTTEALQVV
ncbi:MAG: hypothetical protein ACXADX_20395, partial [Candidatus Hodarchaeales archaeon]